MANPTTNYGFVLPTATDLVTDLPADFDVALQGVDTRLKALQPGTTTGDLAYSSATANTNTRLPIGTSGQVLAVSGGGVPAWTTTADVTPLTTKGDLFTFTTVDARIGVGANNTVLTADSAEASGLKWATPSAPSFIGAFAYQTTAQTLSNATKTAMSLQAELYDTNTFHDNTTNNSRMTIPSGQGGKYLIGGMITYADDTTGYRSVAIRKNGSEAMEFYGYNSGAAAGGPFGSIILDLIATDYIEIYGRQAAGGNLPTVVTAYTGGQTGVFLYIQKVG